MKYALRSAASVAMLSVVGLVASAAVLVFATVLFVAFSAGGVWSILAGIVLVGLLGVIGVGLLARRRSQKRRACEGVSITTEEQPLFWVEVYRVAEGLNMRPPDELLLFPDASVAVSEERTWLGVRPGVRRLHLGLPLLAGLTERELRAVVAQEFCRCWGPLSWGRLIYRGREIIGMVADRMGEESKVGRLVGRYGRAYLAVSSSVTRRYELEAVRRSADLAGNDAATAALSGHAVLNEGWSAFVDGYAGPAAAVGCRPEQLFAGFTSFLDEPGRREQLAEAAVGAGPQQRSAYASQLVLEDRLAVIASLPADDLHDKSGPALGVMRNPDQVIHRVEESMYHESGFVPATWENIVPEAGVAAAREDALQLARLGHEGGLGATLSVEALMELMGLGLVDEMVRPMLAAGASQEAERHMAGRLVTGFLATAAIESGTASYRFSWVAPRLLVDERGVAEDLPQLVDAALADQGEIPALELWLESHRVGQTLELGADLGQAVREDPSAPTTGNPGDPSVGPSGTSHDDSLDDPRALLLPVSGTTSG